MASNKSAYLDKLNEPLRVAESEIPKPGPNDIVIRNHAVAINPVDAMQYSKGVFVKNFPYVLGSDSAGEVHDVGSEVSQFKKGDRVVGHSWAFLTGKAEDGSYQLYSNVPAGNSAIIPSNISYAEASVFPMAVDTASNGLFAEGSLELTWPHEGNSFTGKSVIVYGASSSVGVTAVQLATLAGYKVIGVASRKNETLVKEAGAAQNIDYNDSDVVDQLVKSVDASSFVGVYDAIGTPASHQILVPVLEQLGGKGRYASTKAIPENLPAGVRTKRVFGIGDFSFPLWQKFISKALESGKLKPLPKPEVIGKGLEIFQDGIELIGKGVSAKKLVVEL